MDCGVIGKLVEATTCTWYLLPCASLITIWVCCSNKIILLSLSTYCSLCHFSDLWSNLMEALLQDRIHAFSCHICLHVTTFRLIGSLFYACCLFHSVSCCMVMCCWVLTMPECKFWTCTCSNLTAGSVNKMVHTVLLVSQSTMWHLLCWFHKAAATVVISSMHISFFFFDNLIVSQACWQNKLMSHLL